MNERLGRVSIARPCVTGRVYPHLSKALCFRVRLNISFHLFSADYVTYKRCTLPGRLVAVRKRPSLIGRLGCWLLRLKLSRYRKLHSAAVSTFEFFSFLCTVHLYALGQAAVMHASPCLPLSKRLNEWTKVTSPPEESDESFLL